MNGGEVGYYSCINIIITWFIFEIFLMVRRGREIFKRPNQNFCESKKKIYCIPNALEEMCTKTLENRTRQLLDGWKDGRKDLATGIKVIKLPHFMMI